MLTAAKETSPVSTPTTSGYTGFFLYFGCAQHKFGCFPSSAAKSDVPSLSRGKTPAIQAPHLWLKRPPVQKPLPGDFEDELHHIKKEFDREGSVMYSTIELNLEIDANSFTNTAPGTYKLYFDDESTPLVTGDFTAGLDPTIPKRMFTNQIAPATILGDATLTGIDIDIPGTIMGSELGSISYHKWNDIAGVSVSYLTSDPDYPDNPDHKTTLTMFEAPSDVDDYYGGRILGYLHPGETGEYTFWIAADDMCELWLSPDFDPGNKVKIAYHDGWTNSQEWEKYGSQQSTPITLEAGEIYYIEAIFKEHDGGDNCAVAWQGPGIPQRAVIDGSFLSPVHDGECTSVAYHLSGLSEEIQAGSRLDITFGGQPVDAADLPCGASGENQYVFNYDTEVNQVMAGIALNYFGARYYDPEIGYWTSTDPMDEFWSTYSYTGGNPVNLIDPWGLYTTQEEANKLGWEKSLDRLEQEYNRQGSSKSTADARQTSNSEASASEGGESQQTSQPTSGTSEPRSLQASEPSLVGGTSQGEFRTNEGGSGNSGEGKSRGRAQGLHIGGTGRFMLGGGAARRGGGMGGRYATNSGAWLDKTIAVAEGVNTALTVGSLGLTLFPEPTTSVAGGIGLVATNVIGLGIDAVEIGTGRKPLSHFALNLGVSAPSFGVGKSALKAGGAAYNYSFKASRFYTTTATGA